MLSTFQQPPKITPEMNWQMIHGQLHCSLSKIKRRFYGTGSGDRNASNRVFLNTMRGPEVISRFLPKTGQKSILGSISRSSLGGEGRRSFLSSRDGPGGPELVGEAETGGPALPGACLSCPNLDTRDFGVCKIQNTIYIFILKN